MCQACQPLGSVGSVGAAALCPRYEICLISTFPRLCKKLISTIFINSKGQVFLSVSFFGINSYVGRKRSSA